MWHIMETMNYKFHFKPGSYAEDNLDEIVKIQERCFQDICKALNVTPQMKIEYYLCDSAEEVGKIYGDNEPCNGFTKIPNQIYAVYSNEKSCVGYHEDAHIISYLTLARPIQNFVREGLAMYFDQDWWGIPNKAWTKYLSSKELLPSINELFSNSIFRNYEEVITYPLAGEFTSYLISKYGIEAYKDFYTKVSDDFATCFEKKFKLTITQCEKEFLQHLKNFDLSEEYITMIESRLQK